MYIAKLELNERNREVHRDLGNAHALHQRIMQAFPDEQREQARAGWNILFRQEPDSSVVLVQSAIAGNWDQLPSAYLITHQSKEFTAEVQQFKAGRILQFRLKANPSKRDNKTKKLIGMLHASDQIAWLERQAAQHGFSVQGVDLMPMPNIFGIKKGAKAPIRLGAVLYQGILQITESDRFVAALQSGIGRGRSYGCGLLSTAQLRY